MSLLEFQQVGYWYKDKSQPLFQDINIGFQKGKFYTIVGTSGTGKTTFLSLAGGLDAPKEGNILYDGKAVSKIGLTNFRNQCINCLSGVQPAPVYDGFAERHNRYGNHRF